MMKYYTTIELPFIFRRVLITLLSKTSQFKELASVRFFMKLMIIDSILYATKRLKEASWITKVSETEKNTLLTNSENSSLPFDSQNTLRELLASSRESCQDSVSCVLSRSLSPSLRLLTRCISSSYHIPRVQTLLNPIAPYWRYTNIPLTTTLLALIGYGNRNRT